MARPPGYRYGSWLILHGSGAHLVGFSTACWLAYESNDTIGLWTRCHRSQCTLLRMINGEVPAWLSVTRGLASLSVVLVIFWLVVSCQCQWLRMRQQRYSCLTRLEEMLAMGSGCCSMLAVGLFVMSTARDKELRNFSLSWSLWLVVGGASAITIGGVIVATTRNYALRGAPKPMSRCTIGPSVGEGGASLRSLANEGGEQGHETGGSGQRRYQSSGNVTDIFHVSGPTLQACSRMHSMDSVQCWAAVPPPPPYFYSCQPETNYPDAPTRDDPSRRESDTAVMEVRWTFSPPPPYEDVVSDLIPPPYQEHAPSHMVNVVPRDSSGWL